MHTLRGLSLLISFLFFFFLFYWPSSRKATPKEQAAAKDGADSFLSISFDPVYFNPVAFSRHKGSMVCFRRKGEKGIYSKRFIRFSGNYSGGVL